MAARQLPPFSMGTSAVTQLSVCAYVSLALVFVLVFVSSRSSSICNNTNTNSNTLR